MRREPAQRDRVQLGAGRPHHRLHAHGAGRRASSTCPARRSAACRGRARYKRQILASRLAGHAARSPTRCAWRATPPAVFVSGSAVGYYGDRPGQKLTEAVDQGHRLPRPTSSTPGSRPPASRPEKTRVVTVRSGVVVGRGGAMKPLLPAREARAGRPDRQPAASTGRGSASTTRPRRSCTCSTRRSTAR